MLFVLGILHEFVGFYDFNVKLWFLLQIGFVFQIYQQETIKNIKVTYTYILHFNSEYCFIFLYEIIQQNLGLEKESCTFSFVLVLAEIMPIFFI